MLNTGKPQVSLSELVICTDYSPACPACYSCPHPCYLQWFLNYLTEFPSLQGMQTEYHTSRNISKSATQMQTLLTFECRITPHPCETFLSIVGCYAVSSASTPRYQSHPLTSDICKTSLCIVNSSALSSLEDHSVSWNSALIPSRLQPSR